MLTPERFRELLLDYLYDLLDDADAAAVNEYVQAHPEAQSDIARVRGLMTQAAKAQFPDVSFRPPTAADAVVAREASRPTTLPAPAQPARPLGRSMSGVWIRWAVVASILLIIGTLAFPTFSHVGGYLHQKERVDSTLTALNTSQNDLSQLIAEHDKKRQDAKREREALKEELVQLESDRVTKLHKAEEEERNKQIVMTVTGPAAIQSGAPNEFMISTKYRNSQNAVTRIDVRVRDQDKNIVFEEKDLTSLGQVRVVLPPDVPYKPNSRLSIDVTAQDTGGKARSVLTEELSWAAPRYVTHLATDKPMYQPGQNVYFRSLTLNRATMQPPEEDFQLEYSVFGPKGQKIWSLMGETRLRSAAGSRVLLGPDQKPIHGIGAGEYRISDTADGGEYTLAVREIQNRFPEEKRKFLVNNYKPDRLFKELDFHRKTYGAGDEVIANCKVSTEAGPVVNKEVAAVIINVDGREVPAVALGRTDANGWVRIRTVLPKEIDKGNASMTVVFTDGGARESIQKPIPITIKKLFVEFYPEGGQIVAGAPNRVYFQARNTLDKPAELKGKIVDASGKAVADVVTLHDDREPGANQGMGLFTFTPEKDGKYTLKIDEPAGIEGVHALPATQNDGIAMQAPTGVTSGKESIRVVLHTPGKSRNLFVGAYCRGRMLAAEHVTTKPDAAALVELKPEDSLGGVVRITVFEDQSGDSPRKTLVPRAERLVFRKSDRKINFQIQPDKPRYAPSESARIAISATDEKGNPASAIVMVGVVNQQIITMADEKVFRTMPTHFAMVGEVKRAEELEYADFLLSDHPAGAKALDLLLGVQGWRRFVEQGPRNKPQGADAELDRLLVMTGQAGVREVFTLFHKRQEIEASFAPKRKDLIERLEAAVIADRELNRDSEYPQAVQLKRQEISDNRNRHAAAVAALAPFDSTNRQIRSALVPVLGLVCFAIVVIGIAVAAARGLKRTAPYLVTATAVVAGCILVIIGLSVADFGDAGRGGSPMAATGSRPTVADDNAMREAAMPMDAPGMPAAPGMAGAPAEDRKKEAKAMDMAMPKAMAGRGVPPAPGPAAPNAPGGAAPRKMEPMALRAPDPAKKPDVADGLAMKRAPDAKAGIAKFEQAKGAMGAERGDLARRKDAKGLLPDRDQGRGLRGGNGVVGELQKEMRDVEREVVERLAKDKAFGGAAGPGMAKPGMPGGGGGFALQPAAQPFVVREYSHAFVRATGDVRDDQTETVYWHPVLVLPGEKKTDIGFQLAGEITRYRILVAGHTLDGRLGSATHQIEARKPFSLEAKLPREVTASDKIDLPVIITNDTDTARSVLINIAPKNFELRTGAADTSALLKPNSRSRRIYRLQPGIVEGEAELKLDGASEPFASDSVVKRIPVVPDGYPVNQAISDLLEKEVLHTVTLPDDFVKGTLKLRAQIYPSTVADLQKGLEGLLREPYGCFEQTSTSNYPNTLILNYLKTSDRANPEAERRARELLQRGYQRLTSFECERPGGAGREGYEWFGGQAPPHQALTAYGLMQFNDMVGVFDVDRQMVARTREYLLNQRTGDGSFRRNARALDTFGRAPQHVTDAYIVWALTETGKDNLDKEIDHLLKEQGSSTDPYFLALLGNALLNCDGAQRRAKGLELLKKVKDKQAADGGLDGAQTSITHSGGRDLRIETTALAVLGWLKANSPADFAVALDKAVKWITQQRGGYGGFGSTQSTILALKALIGHTQANKKPAESGHLTLYVNGNIVERRFFDAGEQGEIFVDMKEPERFLKPGKNEVRLTLSTKRPYPYTLGWNYQTLTPASDEKCQVKLTTKLDKTQVREGDGVRLTATIENLGGPGKGQPMTMAIIGLPAGLKVPEDMKQLKDLALLRRTGPDGEFESGPISFFEIRGRELVLYWRDLKPEAKIEVSVDLIAEIPGEYRGPASRAYLYYTADHKHWVKPLEITITATDPTPE